jgi:hypothetical protein
MELSGKAARKPVLKPAVAARDWHWANTVGLGAGDVVGERGGAESHCGDRKGIERDAGVGARSGDGSHRNTRQSGDSGGTDQDSAAGG